MGILRGKTGNYLMWIGRKRERRSKPAGKRFKTANTIFVGTFEIFLMIQGGKRLLDFLTLNLLKIGQRMDCL